jgi:hypothetical protein
VTTDQATIDGKRASENRAVISIDIKIQTKSWDGSLHRMSKVEITRPQEESVADIE